MGFRGCGMPIHSEQPERGHGQYGDRHESEAEFVQQFLAGLQFDDGGFFVILDRFGKADGGWQVACPTNDHAEETGHHAHFQDAPLHAAVVFRTHEEERPQTKDHREEAGNSQIWPEFSFPPPGATGHRVAVQEAHGDGSVVQSTAAPKDSEQEVKCAHDFDRFGHDAACKNRRIGFPTCCATPTVI